MAARPATLGEMLACLRRSWLAVLAWTGLGGLAACAWMAQADPVFQARATILIEPETPSGLLGDLAWLTTLASAPAAASELEVLQSRTLAEATLAEGRDEQGRWNAADERHVGLTTLVDDEGLRPLALLWRTLFEPPPPDIPLVLPERELLARAERTDPDAPECIRIEFLDELRLRISTAGLAERLGLAKREPRELAYAPLETLEYRGLTLALEARGDCVGASFLLELLPPHEALERLREHIEVQETALNSGVIELVLEDSDPRRAARTANALLRNYLDALAARSERRAARTVDYIQRVLEEQFALFRSALETIERAQQGAPELLAPEGAATSLIEEMATLEVERIQVELASHAFEEIGAALAAGDAHALARLDGAWSAGVLVDPVTSGYLEELAALDAQLGLLGAEFTDEHPSVTRNRAAAADLLARTRQQLASRLDGLRSRTGELARSREALRERLRGLPGGVRELAEAQAQLEVHREVVPYLVKGLQGAEITRSSAETRAEILDLAAAPTELASPDPARALPLGLLLGLSLGVVRALLREPRRGRIHSLAELAEATAAERAVRLPRLPPPGTLWLEAAPAGAEAEALRALRFTLHSGSVPAGRRVLGVTAVAPDEAAAIVAAELALALALEGTRTLLVEADLRHPSLADRFGLSPAGGGLAQHLEQGASWRELVRPARTGGLELLPAGTPARPAGDLLARTAMERLLAEAAANWEAVVLALPAQEEAPELSVMTRACDVLLVVHRARTLPRRRVEAAASALRAAGGRAFVAVLIDDRRA